MINNICLFLCLFGDSLKFITDNDGYVFGGCVFTDIVADSILLESNNRTSCTFVMIDCFGDRCIVFPWNPGLCAQCCFADLFPRRCRSVSNENDSVISSSISSSKYSSNVIERSDIFQKYSFHSTNSENIYNSPSIFLVL